MCGAGMTPANPELRRDIAAAFIDNPQQADRLSLLGVRGDMEALYAAADVVALTPMTVARLTRQGYDRFAAHTSAMQQQLATMAALRAGATARKLLSGR